MGEFWNWWPLSQRTRSPQSGFCRLRWETAQRFIDVPNQNKAKIEEAIATAPAFIDMANPDIVRLCSPGQPSHATGSDGRGANLPMTCGADSSMQPLAPYGPQQHAQAARSSATAGDSQSFPIAQNVKGAMHVYLCITTGSSHDLSSLECHSAQTDLTFFADLKAEYLGARGRLRFLLSMWRYDHCEFYRVRE